MWQDGNTQCSHVFMCIPDIYGDHLIFLSHQKDRPSPRGQSPPQYPQGLPRQQGCSYSAVRRSDWSAMVGPPARCRHQRTRPNPHHCGNTCGRKEITKKTKLCVSTGDGIAKATCTYYDLVKVVKQFEVAKFFEGLRYYYCYALTSSGFGVTIYKSTNISLSLSLSLSLTLSRSGLSPQSQQQ